MAEKEQNSNARPAAKAKSKAGKESFWSGVKKEWNKIIWAPANEVGRQTGLVVFISIVLGVIITVIDQGALHVIDWILSF
ncbi:MAG: preprotein translocase subunit SecE [Eubacteriales bacterium]|nr:preprotein translocase subunit SecE [Eubacteriales bacterium]